MSPSNEHLNDTIGTDYFFEISPFEAFDFYCRYNDCTEQISHWDLPLHRWVGIDRSSPKSVRSFSWLDRRRGEAKTEAERGKNEAKKCVRRIQELYKRVNEIEVKNKERVSRWARDGTGKRQWRPSCFWLVNRVKNRDDEM